MTARIQPTITKAKTAGPLGRLTSHAPSPIQTSRIAGPTKGFGLGGEASVVWTASVMPPRLSHRRFGAVLPDDHGAGDQAAVLALLHDHEYRRAPLHVRVGPASEL